MLAKKLTLKKAAALLLLPRCLLGRTCCSAGYRLKRLILNSCALFMVLVLHRR